MNFQIWVLFIAIVLFGLLAFKQVSALILAPVITIFVAICSGLPILDSLQNQFMPAAISAGCWTWSMSGPGSPSIQNYIAMTNLGTPATAAFVPSLLTTIAMFALIFAWLEYRARKFTKKGLVFDDASLKYQLTDEELSTEESRDLPHWSIAFLPIVIILTVFNLLKFPVETAVLAGIAASVLLMFRRVGGLNRWIEVFNKGAADSGVAILNTAIVVGFGGVVQNTQGFSDLVLTLKGLHMPPLVFVMLTVAVCAGACGSASGGMGVAFNALKGTYMEMGINFQYVHRIAAIAAGTLDTLPHQGAQITLLGICKMTHKEAYWDIAVTQIIIPFIACGFFIVLASLGL